MRFFFFGTLLDPDVLQLVLGRALPPDQVRPARLSGHRRVRVVDAIYPMLLADPSDAVEGSMVDGLSEHDAGRICLYEGTDYRLCRCQVELADGRRRDAYRFEACSLVPEPLPWDFSAWQLAEKALLLDGAQDWLAALDQRLQRDASREWRRRRNELFPAAALDRAPSRSLEL